MDVVKYYWGILRRSLSDTRQFWGIEPARIFRGLLVFVLGILIYYKLFGLEAALHEWQVWLTFVIFGGIAAIGLSWMWSLIMAPFRAAKEQQEAWDTQRDAYIVENERLRDQVSELDAELKPKMELSRWEVGKDRYQGSPQFFRICVNSTGGETVRSVQAFLTKLVPAPRILLPLHLHFSHDQNRNLTKEDLSPGALLWVYVAALYEHGDLVVCSTVAGERNIRLPVLSEPYEMGITVTADNSGYIDKSFRIWVESDSNRLRVVEMPPSLVE